MAIHPRMATYIDRYEAIEQLQVINDIPIQEIDERARPGRWAQSGFIGPKETIPEVLLQDWQTVQALGTTHIELAAHLRAIWDRVSAEIEGTARFTYSVSELPDHSLQEYKSSAERWDRTVRKVVCLLGIILGVGAIIAAFLLAPSYLLALLPAAGCIAYASREKGALPAGQTLEGRIDRHKGNQNDLFAHNDREAYRRGWNSQLTLTNPSNNLSVLIGEGVIGYIEKYGFYEGGGEQNGYRIDPAKLVAILTGRPA